MNRFALARPKSYTEAKAALLDSRYSLPVLKAGGMDILDHLKEGLIEPDLLVDIKRLSAPDGKGERISTEGNSITIAASSTLSEITDSSLINQNAPVLAQSVADAATPQIRNVATAVGNILQRPRCWYYRNKQFECLKKGGMICFAREGENKYHAIFGDGPCHIVHPSNLAPALQVCNARMHVIGGKRNTIDLDNLFHLPDQDAHSEYALKPGEIITHITCDHAPHSGFYAIKEKQSFDWPLVMAAVSLEIKESTITNARVCAGAVAPIPWSLPGVEKALRGVNLDDEAKLKNACARAVDGAQPMSQNKYKLQLLPVAIRRAVLRAAGRVYEPENPGGIA